MTGGRAELTARLAAAEKPQPPRSVRSAEELRAAQNESTAATATSTAAAAAQKERLRLRADVEHPRRRCRRGRGGCRRVGRVRGDGTGGARSGRAGCRGAAVALQEALTRVDAARHAVAELSDRDEADRLTARLGRIDVAQRDLGRIAGELAAIASPNAVSATSNPVLRPSISPDAQVDLTAPTVVFTGGRRTSNWSVGDQRVTLAAGQTHSLTVAEATAVGAAGCRSLCDHPGCRRLPASRRNSLRRNGSWRKPWLVRCRRRRRRPRASTSAGANCCRSATRSPRRCPGCSAMTTWSNCGRGWPTLRRTRRRGPRATRRRCAPNWMPPMPHGSGPPRIARRNVRSPQRPPPMHREDQCVQRFCARRPQRRRDEHTTARDRLTAQRRRSATTTCAVQAQAAAEARRTRGGRRWRPCRCGWPKRSPRWLPPNWTPPAPPPPRSGDGTTTSLTPSAMSPSSSALIGTEGRNGKLDAAEVGREHAGARARPGAAPRARRPDAPRGDGAAPRQHPAALRRAVPP